MTTEEVEDKTTYEVVVNHEEQYSIWPADRELPLGWKTVGKQGSKDDCLTYIEEVWTDMRPLSLRKQMEEMARQQEKQDKDQVNVSTNEQEAGTDDEPEIDPLVQQLAEGNHPVIASRVENSVAELKRSIERGYTHIKFTDTQGGTELGVELDQEATSLDNADFDEGTGEVHLAGHLTLNYVPVRCIADIDLASLAGSGHLEIIED